jgi:hypothetical protein
LELIDYVFGQKNTGGFESVKSFRNGYALTLISALCKLSLGIPMAEAKTKVNKASVEKFLKSIENPQKRADCFVICKMMEKATKSKAEMWGTAIVGFGRKKYTYANGKEAEWMLIGFSPRKQNIALYGLKVFTMTNGGLVEKKGENDFLLKLGKYKEGGGCLYINKLGDINTKELEKIIKLAVRRSR